MSTSSGGEKRARARLALGPALEVAGPSRYEVPEIGAGGAFWQRKSPPKGLGQTTTKSFPDFAKENCPLVRAHCLGRTNMKRNRSQRRLQSTPNVEVKVNMHKALLQHTIFLTVLSCGFLRVWWSFLRIRIWPLYEELCDPPKDVSLAQYEK